MAYYPKRKGGKCLQREIYRKNQRVTLTRNQRLSSHGIDLLIVRGVPLREQNLLLLMQRNMVIQQMARVLHEPCRHQSDYPKRYSREKHPAESIRIGILEC